MNGHDSQASAITSSALPLLGEHKEDHRTTLIDAGAGVDLGEGEDWSPGGLSYCRGPVKRAVDASIALTALILLAPLFLIVALIIVLTSDGPAFYSQERSGMSWRRFRVWKFRTMRPGADRGPLITARGDRRVTRVGRLLRATKIDELPQLFNVLMGDMSLVGPRPQTDPYVRHCPEAYDKILLTRPGLTSPATIHFRYEEWLLSAVPESTREDFYRRLLQDKVRMNFEYIERASFAYDLRLIGATVVLLFRTRNRKSIAFLKASAGLPEA